MCKCEGTYGLGREIEEVRKKLISAIYLKNGGAVASFTEDTPFSGGDAVKLAADYSNRGADALIVFDLSEKDLDHEKSLTLIRKMVREADMPVWGAGNIKVAEDVKKILYTGCRRAILNYSKSSNMEMFREVSQRFGREKISVCIDTREDEALTEETKAMIEAYAGSVIIITDVFLYRRDRLEFANLNNVLITVMVVGSEAKIDGRDTLSKEEKLEILKKDNVEGLCEDLLCDPKTSIMELKHDFKSSGADMNTFESSINWDGLKSGSDGLVPCVVQDYRNEEVLMVAWMDREAFEDTIRTGRMTYWSRSRHEKWVKGMTSGHFQYLKEMRVDCDRDTLLARVLQIGAACHTGNRSCFYTTILKKDTPLKNTLKVFEDVYSTIEDRKAHPKEGSYTNYLFNKGIDKILKKCGEEATEIVIAAKNPNQEEVKYEMADFLYHMMVLMVELGLSWDEIAQELANRE